MSVQALSIPLYIVACDICRGHIEASPGVWRTFPDEDAGVLHASTKGWWVGYDEGMGQVAMCPTCKPENDSAGDAEDAFRAIQAGR
jgi:hypothetical protein